jgi:ApaG protein
MSTFTTQGIKVLTKPFYIAEESDPENDRYIFGYEISIINEGDRTAQLIDRHWIITNGQNQREEVRGEGVVGNQPILEPGQSFVYHSYCPLSTDYGIMKGTYGMVRPDGERFEATIAPFVLMPQWMLN